MARSAKAQGSVFNFVNVENISNGVPKLNTKEVINSTSKGLSKRDQAKPKATPKKTGAITDSNWVIIMEFCRAAAGASS
jgi:hypothetical protein